MNTVDDRASDDNAQRFREHCVLAARRFYTLGYSPIPLRGKLPEDANWQTNSYSLFDLEPKILAGSNIGLPFGIDLGDGRMLVALDVDIPFEREADAAYRAIGLDAPYRIGRHPKFLMPVIVHYAEAGSCDFSWYNAKGERISLQILGRGRRAPAGPKQAAIYGIHPDTGKPYNWIEDSHKRNIFKMRPTDWPFVPELQALIDRVSAALAQFGWATRARHARNLGIDDKAYDGPITERDMAIDRDDIERTMRELAGMVAGTGRGSKAHQLGLRIGVAVRRGLFDLDQLIERIREAAPDNHNAPREFERGVMSSTGERYKTIHAAQDIDWMAKAKAEGLKPEDFMGAAPNGAEEQARQQQAHNEEVKREAKETYQRALVVGVCDLMAKALKERDPEKKTHDEGVGWGFMASLLAAGMVTHTGLTCEWNLRQQWLCNTNLQRFGPDAKRIENEIPHLQPSEPGWAEHAAGLLQKNKANTAGDAIRAAQYAHKAKAASGAEAGSIEADILASMGIQDWDRDNNDAEAGSFSNFKFFMGGQLFVWPFYDEFTETIVFRRLLRKGGDFDIVSDATLARWSQDLEAAAAELYALARDRTKPWGSVSYTPHRADIAIWIPALIGDDPRCRFNSVVNQMRDWQPWDGKERLGDWLARYTETMPWEQAYDHVCAVGAHYLRNWTHRLENPGSKWDEVLTLVGLQGERKTTMFETLADCVLKGSYLAGQRLDFDGKTGINRIAEATRGKLLVEMAELTSLGRRDMEHVKALLSMTTDSGRKTFGSASYSRPRQFGIVGTANCSLPDMTPARALQAILAAPGGERGRVKRELMARADIGFLSDPSGSRRFHPVLINAVKINLEALALEAPQLIAEARAQVAEDRGRLQLPLELQGAVEHAAERFHATDGWDDAIKVKILMPLEGATDFKIALVDVRRVLGAENASSGQGATKLRAALERCGLQVKQSNAMWVFKGAWVKAQRVPIADGAGAAKLMAAPMTPPPMGG